MPNNDYMPKDDEGEQSLLFRFQNWFDGRYIKQDGVQKLINSAVIGSVVLILTAFFTALAGLFTGLIHLP